MPRCRSFAAFAGAFTTSLARTMSVCALLHAVHAGHQSSSLPLLILFSSSIHCGILFLSSLYSFFPASLALSPPFALLQETAAVGGHDRLD